MKKLNVLRLLLCIPAILLMAIQMDASIVSSSETKEILISHESTEPEGAPRSLGAIIEAYYDTDLLCVCAYLSNAGISVSVGIVNQTTNESEEYVISGSGSSALPISGNPGYWTITFTLQSGDVYIGEFIL